MGASLLSAPKETVVSGQMLERFERIETALTLAFDVAFTRIDEQTAVERLSVQGWHVAKSLAAGDALVEEVDGDQADVYVCLNSDGCRLLAYARCGVTDASLARKLARQVYVNVLQEAEIGDAQSASMAYVSQLTHDFEELCWLRSLAAGLEYCHASHHVVAVTQSVLPTLCQLIRADTLAVVPAADATAAASADAAVPAYQCGATPVPDLKLAQIVQEFAGDCLDHPLIYNEAVAQRRSPSGVRSCILVAIRHHDRIFGHLVALNRRPMIVDDLSSPHGFTSASADEETEFGTIEATLLSAAAMMLGTHISNVQLFRDKEQLLIGVIRALINAMDAKDSYTCGHSDRVALIARRIAEQIGLDPTDCERVYMAGLLHDIGKIGIPDDVLTKPGKLTDEEFQIIKEHPTIGHSILRHVSQLEFVLPGVLHHHEMVNGHGYPHALAGEAIPLIGRILAVADAYDAMTSCRPYRQAMPTQKAEGILRDGAGTQWDARIVDAFFAALPDIHSICSRAEEHTASILAGAENQSADTADSVRTAVAAMHVAG
jgi:putative nucleotidyltransferase with HDIG domain